MPDDVFAGIYADMLATQGGILLRDTEEGVTVARVLEGSRAAEAGFAEGQVVIRIDDQEVSDTTQAVLALQREGAFLGRSVEVRVRVVDKDGNTVRRDLTLDLRDLE
jgi:S1-C subfamily serine protease